jgi:3-dehydroquinate dehydratase II
VSRRFRPAGEGPRVLVLHGPNLGALGRRDPAHYGRLGLDGIMARLEELAGTLGVAVEGLQSDDEGELVSELLAAHGRGVAAAVLNPGALAHTSYAVRDAVEAAGIPVVEVHLSNVHARERWRHRLAVAPAAAGVVAGFGPASYELGLRAAAALIERSTRSSGGANSAPPDPPGGSGPERGAAR